MQRARRPLEMRADADRGDQPDPELALTADVEEAAAERERDRERREDERRCDEQRLLEVAGRVIARLAGDPGEEPVEARALEDRLVGGDRVLAVDRNDEPADEERKSGRSDGVRRCRRPGSRTIARRRRFRSAVRVPGRRSSGLLPPSARHCDTELLLGDVRRVLADDATLVDDEDPVGEREDLVELERDEQYRRAPRPVPGRAADGRTRWPRRPGRAWAGRRAAPAGRARSRVRARPSAGCRPDRALASVSGPPPRTSNSSRSPRARSTSRRG